MTATLHPTDETDTEQHATTDDSPVVLGQIIELSPLQVAQHPDNVRDPGRDLPALTASVAEVGVLVPLIVVPAAKVPGHDWPAQITHVAIDGNRRQAAAAGVLLPCVVRADLATAKATIRAMAVTGLVRDGLTAAEEAHAVAALFDLKFSAAAISRATGRSKTHLAAARTAATLTGPAAQETAAYPLTIDQLATPTPVPPPTVPTRSVVSRTATTKPSPNAAPSWPTRASPWWKWSPADTTPDRPVRSMRCGRPRPRPEPH